MVNDLDGNKKFLMGIGDALSIKGLVDGYENGTDIEKRNIFDKMRGYGAIFEDPTIEQLFYNPNVNPDSAVSALKNKAGTDSMGAWRGLEDLTEYRLENDPHSEIFIDYIPILKNISEKVNGPNFTDSDYTRIKLKIGRIKKGELGKETSMEMGSNYFRKSLGQIEEDGKTLEEHAAEDVLKKRQLEGSVHTVANLLSKNQDLTEVKGAYLTIVDKEEVKPWVEDKKADIINYGKSVGDAGEMYCINLPLGQEYKNLDIIGGFVGALYNPEREKLNKELLNKMGPAGIYLKDELVKK